MHPARHCAPRRRRPDGPEIRLLVKNDIPPRGNSLSERALAINGAIRQSNTPHCSNALSRGSLCCLAAMPILHALTNDFTPLRAVLARPVSGVRARRFAAGLGIAKGHLVSLRQAPRPLAKRLQSRRRQTGGKAASERSADGDVKARAAALFVGFRRSLRSHGPAQRGLRAWVFSRFRQAIAAIRRPHRGKAREGDRPDLSRHAARIIDEMAVATFVLDRDGRVAVWNDACVRLTGLELGLKILTFGNLNTTGLVNVSNFAFANSTNLWINISTTSASVPLSSFFTIGKGKGINEYNLSGIEFGNSTSGFLGINQLIKMIPTTRRLKWRLINTARLIIF